MIVQPKVRSFICTTAHPEGCARHVGEWVNYAKQRSLLTGGAPKKVLIIGASTGFGLASRIVAAFGGRAKTIGIFFERPASGKRTASTGWYNTAAFEGTALAAGLYAKSINGDAFSDEIKQQTIDLIQKDWQGGVDLVIYSIASPRRIHPHTGKIFNSVLKPIGQTYHNKTVDVMTGEVSLLSIEPATEKEIRDTEAVMGGHDWALWINALFKHNCLAEGVKTVAFTYIGPELTHAVYRNGTIGRAKLHLEKTAKELDSQLQSVLSGQALISVNKALVTQASAAIPVVPLYISLLYKIMKEKNIHEGCIEQMWRLFKQRLYSNQNIPTDSEGRIRIDDWEMREDVQAEIKWLWESINSGNVETLSDIAGYREDFYKLFGFGLNGIDYERHVEIEKVIPSIAVTPKNPE
ncbi:trans-2-enoyl-CoA reductase family protein [Coxiella endosymbiont of Ornithodoros amblus]|uniref:enoyl-ACP reductase FabV n=1 Tax=Coxiella endosymbiont of Ornithodoros amblus TaxID=1656166 RepID=UPI00244E2B53|nr:enoyl-ACP reductase FabV [Coxiella endosymbiont of Ornithodoros amblus]MBW5802929.1 trans-2-enoyl-CoA reductase family protein [Coxiella endosymbiont of Ornithodoros amblus]